jgi:hypothetical protein
VEKPVFHRSVFSLHRLPENGGGKAGFVRTFASDVNHVSPGIDVALRSFYRLFDLQ